MNASSKVVGGLGSVGMADICEPLLNVVNMNKPFKAADRLEPKGVQLDNPLFCGVTRARRCRRIGGA